MRMLIAVVMVIGCFCVNAWAMNEKGLVESSLTKKMVFFRSG